MNAWQGHIIHILLHLKQISFLSSHILKKAPHIPSLELYFWLAAMAADSASWFQLPKENRVIPGYRASRGSSIITPRHSTLSQAVEGPKRRVSNRPLFPTGKQWLSCCRCCCPVVLYPLEAAQHDNYSWLEVVSRDHFQIVSSFS